MIQRKFFLVQRGDFFAVFRATDDDFSARDFIRVERMHRLTEFQQHEISNIHHGRYRTQSAERKAFSQPGGRLFFHPLRVAFHVPADIAGAKVRRLHIDGNGLGFGFVFFERNIGRFQRGFRDCRHFARNAVHALTIGAVCREGNIENIIVQSHDFFNIFAERRIAIQIKQTVHSGALVKIFVDAEFVAGTEHAVRFHAAKLAFFYFFHAVRIFFQLRGICFAYGGIIERHRRTHTDVYVGSARNDLQISAVFFAAIHRADLHVIAVRMRNKRFHFARHYPIDFAAEISNFFHFEPAGKQLFRKLFRGNIYIHVIFQPTVRYFHYSFRSLPVCFFVYFAN